MVHESVEILRARIADARRQVLPGLYEHYKNGSVYEIIGFSICEKTDEPQVLYRDETTPDIPFNRSLESFTETVEHNGETVARFKWLAGEIGQISTATSVE